MFVWQKAMFADQSSERGGRQLVEVPLSSLPNQSSAGLPFKQASFFFEMLIRGRPALFTSSRRTATAASPLSQRVAIGITEYRSIMTTMATAGIEQLNRKLIYTLIYESLFSKW